MKSLGGLLPRHGHQTINLSKIETDPTKLYLGTRTPSPACATMTHGSHTPDLNLTRDRYNTGNQGFIRPLFRVSPLRRNGRGVGEQENQAISSQRGQPSTANPIPLPSHPHISAPAWTDRIAVSTSSAGNRTTTLRGCKNDLSLKTTNDDDDGFAANTNNAAIFFGPVLSATDHHGGYKTCG